MALQAQTQPELLLGYEGSQMGFSPEAKIGPPPRGINLVKKDIIFFLSGWVVIYVPFWGLFVIIAD